MIGVDTNVLLRMFINDNDAQWKATGRVFEKSKEASYINIITLCEVLWTLRSVYSYKKPQLIHVIDMLTATDGFVLEDSPVVQEALDIYKEVPIEFPDILIGLRNFNADCSTTLTFDKQAAKLDEFTLLA